MAYAAVGSDETKSSQVFTEPNVKANSAGYRENAGRKRVSVVKNAYQNQYLNKTSLPRIVHRLPQPLKRKRGVSHPNVWCTEHLNSSFNLHPLPEKMRSPSNPKLNPVDFST